MCFDKKFANSIKPLYILPADNLVEEVLIPSFQIAENVDCMIGYFSSASLTALAPGLATFIKNSSHQFRLIINPFLSRQDIEAIELGTRTPEEVAQSYWEELIINENALQQHTLRCLSYLLFQRRIEIKIGLMKDAIFHPKVWLFKKGDNVLSVHGSSNMSNRGFLKNFEQLNTSCSWMDSTQKYTCEKLAYQFWRLWDKKDDDCFVVDASQAIKDSLLREYSPQNPPTEDDFIRIYKEVENVDLVRTEPAEYNLPKRNEFVIPEWILYKDGPFKHQGEAVQAWIDSGHHGILEMATGSGKTITAMICAIFLNQEEKPLLVVVAAPYIPLIAQWCEEISAFGVPPLNLTKFSGSRNRSKQLQKIRRKISSKISDVEIIVVSHDTLCDSEFQGSISKFDCSKLLVGDEVHNLGRKEFINNPPTIFNYRLGLSATPVRQYDQEGTDVLQSFFGQSVYEYSLEDAIGNCLVEYDYFVHPIYLTEEEMDTWHEITSKIKENFWRNTDTGPDDFLSKLYRDRRKLLETAENKLIKLNQLLDEQNLKEIKHTLIYATDKAPTQLEDINSMLNQKGVLFHQLTAEETSQREKCAEIIKNFQDGKIQILTAKRVLDEGVNIPEIQKAYVLASTTVKRQWIQRRGRLLRTSKNTGKAHSEIHDFFVLPPGFDEVDLDSDSKKLVKSELGRIMEFANLARNAGKPDGPLSVLDQVIRSVFL